VAELRDQMVGRGFDVLTAELVADTVRRDAGEDQDVQGRLAEQVRDRDSLARAGDCGDRIGEVVKFGCGHRFLLLL
jgi:hypothetical protein